MDSQIQERRLFVDDSDNLYEVIGLPLIDEYSGRSDFHDVTGYSIYEDLCEVDRENGSLHIVK